jgi:Winged helix DNA-binding domain
VNFNVKRFPVDNDHCDDTIYSPTTLAISGAIGRVHVALAEIGGILATPDLSKTISDDIIARRRRTVHAILRLRRVRGKHLGGAIFADPAWNILLDAYACELDSRKMSVSDACIASQSPYTTALRWLRALEDRDLLVRRDDKKDRRRSFVELTPHARSAMETLIDDAIRTLAMPI